MALCFRCLGPRPQSGDEPVVVVSGKGNAFAVKLIKDLAVGIAMLESQLNVRQSLFNAPGERLHSIFF